MRGASPPSAATAYVAHLLPRREAVWWACQCVSAILGDAAQDEGYRLASQWARQPDDAHRREALAYAESGDLKVATTFLARAAGQQQRGRAEAEHGLPPLKASCAKNVPPPCARGSPPP